MEPQPELVRPYVAVLTGAADPPAEPAEPPAWPAVAEEPSGRPEARGSEPQQPERPGRRSRGLTVVLTLGALAAVGLLVAVTTHGTAPRPGGTQRAALAAPPSVGGRAGNTPAAPVAGPGTPAHASAVPSRTSGSPAARTAGDATPAPADGTLRPGDRGAAVVRLQRLLFQQGFTYVAVTGVYDAATTRGVTQLQHDRGLTGDPVGVYGPQSRAALDPGH